MDMSLSKLQQTGSGEPGVLQFLGSRMGTAERLNNNGIPLFSGNLGHRKVEFSGDHPCPAFKGEKVIHVSLGFTAH